MCKTRNIISDYLLADDELVQGIKILYKQKPVKDIVSKAAEEASELATILLKWLNKPDDVGDDDVIEEMVDVQIHLLLLMKHFGILNQEIMCDLKINKMLNSKSFKKYKASYNGTK